jgi:hypothetical protein
MNLALLLGQNQYSKSIRYSRKIILDHLRLRVRRKDSVLVIIDGSEQKTVLKKKQI